jgi:hypothetical protein
MESIIERFERLRLVEQQQKRISTMEKQKDAYYFGLVEKKTKKVRGELKIVPGIYVIQIKGSSDKFYKLTVSNESIKCSCPDHSFRCKRENLFCKHCLYFNKMALHENFATPDNFLVSQEKLDKIAESMENRQIERVVDPLQSAETYKKTLEKIGTSDECAICLDLLIPEQIVNAQCTQCGECRNFLHTPCVRVWYGVAKTCPYCRVRNTYKI